MYKVQENEIILTIIWSYAP